MQHDIYRSIIMKTSVGFAYHKMIFSKDGTPTDFLFMDVNEFFGKIVGYDYNLILGNKVSTLMDNFTVENFSWKDAFMDVFKSNDGISYTIYSKNLNRFFNINAFFVSKKHFVTVINDITDIQARIQTDDNNIQLIFDAINVGIVCINKAGLCVFCNSKALKILDFKLEEILNRDIREIVRDRNGDKIFSSSITYSDIINETKEQVYWYKNDVNLLVTSKNQIVRGERLGTVLSFYDINLEIKNKLLLDAQTYENNILLRNLSGIVYRASLNRDEKIQYISTHNNEHTDFISKVICELDVVTLNSFVSHHHKDHINHLWVEAIEQKVSFNEEYLLSFSDDKEHWVLENANPIFNDLGEVEAIEGIIINIDNLKKKQGKIDFLTDHDQLTGLYNYQYFEKVKSKYLVDKYMPLSVMIIDINGLRLINQALGVVQGDKSIQTAGRIIESCCRKKDIIARVTGASFIILLPNCSHAEAAEICGKINSIASKYNESVSSSVYNLHLSIGYATLDNLSISFDEIRKEAEEAMYKSKLLDNASIHNSVVSSITTTMFERCKETELHSHRIKGLARRIGQLLNLSQDKLNELLLLATLHDIGKVAISDAIINKPGPLTPEEWTEMRKHPMVGYRIAKSSAMLKPIANYILCHHERWDGNGYPRGLKGTEIPMLSRVISVVDAFDAMTEDRPYRKKLEIKEAIKEIVDNSGSQFDPEIAETFVSMIYNDFKNLLIDKEELKDMYR